MGVRIFFLALFTAMLLLIVSCSSGGGNDDKGKGGSSSDKMKNTTTILSFSSHLNGFDVMDTLIPGEKATIRLSEIPTGAIKIHLQTSKGMKEIISANVSDNNITFVAPLNAIAGMLDVESSDFSTFGISYKIMTKKDPFLETVEPNVATVGESVTIIGQNLPARNALIMFEDDNTSLSATVIDNKIIFSVPKRVKSGTFHVEFSHLKTNLLYLTIKREIPLHVSLAEGVNIDATNISFTEGQIDYTLDTSYNTTMRVQKEGMQYVHALTALPNGEYAALYSAVVLPNMTSLNVDANSTAIAWLFMGMGVSATMSTASLETLYNKLANDPKVQTLANSIAKLQKENFDAWVNLNDANLKTVFQDALRKVITNYNTSVAQARELKSLNESGNEVVITQNPQNSNIYVDDNKYALELTNGKLNNGTVNVVNDTRLFLSIEARDKKTGEIIGNYRHGDPFGKASILGPKGWPLFGISSLKNLQLGGTDTHIEIIAGAAGGVTDKQKLATLLRTRVWFEGVAAPALNMVLSTIIGDKIDKHYEDGHSLSCRIITALTDIYGAGFMTQLTEQIELGKSNWSTLGKDFILDPLYNGLKDCATQNGINGTISAKCEQTAKGIAELIGIGNTRDIGKRLIKKIAKGTEKQIVKKSVALVPVVGWIAETAIVVYDNIDDVTNVATIEESLIDMHANPKEINADIDFPLEVSSVKPTCVAISPSKVTQAFVIDGEGFAPADGVYPEVSIGVENDKRVNTDVTVSDDGTNMIAAFDAKELMDEGSWSDYMFVKHLGVSIMYDKPIRMVSTEDNKVYLDSVVPNRAMLGQTVTLNGCGWVPLENVKVFFDKDGGGKTEAEIVSKKIDKIEVKVPKDAKSGLVYVTTGKNKKSTFDLFDVIPFGIFKTTADALNDGTTFTLEGQGLSTAEHIYFVDHEGNRIEGTIENIDSDRGMFIKTPDGLKIGPVRFYVVLSDGTKSNELTLPKLPKKPTASPLSGVIGNGLTVSLSQKNGLDIYYMLNDYIVGTETKYSSPLNLTFDDLKYTNLTLYAFARVKVDGVNYDSDKAEFYYYPCDEGKRLVNGECEGNATVIKGSYTSDSFSVTFGDVNNSYISPKVTTAWTISANTDITINPGTEGFIPANLNIVVPYDGLKGTLDGNFTFTFTDDVVVGTIRETYDLGEITVGTPYYTLDAFYSGLDYAGMYEPKFDFALNDNQVSGHYSFFYNNVGSSIPYLRYLNANIQVVMHIPYAYSGGSDEKLVRYMIHFEVPRLYL